VRSLTQHSSDAVRDVDLTSMINVVFLLLSFFLVAGVFRTVDSIAVSLPATQITPTELENISPQVSMDAEGNVLINGDTYTAEQLPDAIRNLEPSASLIVRADSTVSAVDVIELLSLAKAAGFKDVGLQTVGKPLSLKP